MEAAVPPAEAGSVMKDQRERGAEPGWFICFGSRR